MFRSDQPTDQPTDMAKDTIVRLPLESLIYVVPSRYGYKPILLDFVFPNLRPKRCLVQPEL